MTRIFTAVLITASVLSAQDPWPATDLIQPHELAARLSGDRGQQRPTILFVGFPVLYRGSHIPGAILAGPCVKEEGLRALRKAVRDMPRQAEIVIYCGCCPFVHCPNVKPAYTALGGMGFSNVKVLFIETNFHTDWVQKGYPVEKAAEVLNR